MSSAEATAKMELEAARAEIIRHEKQIQDVKGALRQLQSASSADGGEEAPNTLEIAVLKIEGLPEGAKPKVSLQLSSPVEEQTLENIFDPKAPSENIAVFSGVEASVATLNVTAKDADIELGVSSLYDVAPLCPVDAMAPKPEYVTELAVAIVAEKAEEEFKDSNEDLTESVSNDVEVPICTVTLRVTYKPSSKDLKEELYDLLNKASQKKAKAIEQLRQSAVAASRAAPSELTTTAKSRSPVVKAGFLNKKKKEPSKLKAWYDRNLGPNSMLRASIIPIGKNYIIFGTAIALFHFQGHQLAIPAPV